MDTVRTVFLVSLIAAVLLLDRVLQADVRTWTDSSGTYRTEAEFVDESDGVVQLKKPDGAIVSVPLDRLSEADQAYIRRQGSVAKPTAVDPLAPSDEDVVLELVTGASITGRITAKSDESVTVQALVSGRRFTRVYPLDRIGAVISGGRRVVLAEAAGGPPSRSAGSPASSGSAGSVKRSRAEVDRLIDDMGRSPPDWWDATPLDYPKSLDLSWPEKPEGQWNAQKNVGQYLWDVVNPNSSKWRSGVRLVHFLLEQHANDRQKRERAMMRLGRMYYLLLQDYARAAFWWRQAGVERSAQGPAGVNLADCFWKLGNKQMAIDFLQRQSRNGTYYFTTIKQLADMGETRSALQLAEMAARGDFADQAYLYAGDACRIEGRYDQAIDYYEKVLAIKPRGKEGQVKRIERAQTRARTNIEGIRTFDNLELHRVPDGSYRAAAPGYAGDVHIEVTVRGGRIEALKVVQHKEKQYYGALTETPRKIVENQGLKGVDAVTSATITSEAIINATARALASGRE